MKAELIAHDGEDCRDLEENHHRKIAHSYPIKTDNSKREAWLNERCKQLKHNTGAIDAIIAEMEIFAIV